MGTLGIIIFFIGCIFWIPMIKTEGGTWYGTDERSKKEAERRNRKQTICTLIGIALCALGAYLMANPYG